MFKHPRPLKRQPQLRSTSPALVLVSAPLASVPLLLRPFRFLLHLLPIPDCPSLCFYSALHLLATLYSPRVYISFLWQALVACSLPIFVLRRTQPGFFFVLPTLPWHFIILISLPSSSFILPDVFLLCFSSPLFHCSEFATSRQRIEEGDQEIELKTRKRVTMEPRDQ